MHLKGRVKLWELAKCATKPYPVAFCLLYNSSCCWETITMITRVSTVRNWWHRIYLKFIDHSILYYRNLPVIQLRQGYTQYVYRVNNKSNPLWFLLIFLALNFTQMINNVNRDISHFSAFQALSSPVVCW